MIKVIAVFILILSSVIYSVDYEYPYLVNGSSPSYFLANQSFGSFSEFENDAYISSKKRFQINLFHTTAMDTLGTESIMLQFRVLNNSFLSLGYSSISDTNIESTSIDSSSFDNPFIKSGIYSYENNHAKAILKHQLNERMTIGIGANYYQTVVHDFKTDGIDFSIGSIIKSTHLDLGLALQNILNASINFDGQEELLPQLGIFSLQLKPSKWMQLSTRATYVNSTIDRDRTILFGAGLHFRPITFIQVSGGITEQFQGLDITSIPAVGIKLDLAILNCDYVFKKSAYKEISDSHLIAIKINI